jgi:uncharacterized membrane protein YhaH (DUF805 family)
MPLPVNTGQEVRSTLYETSPTFFSYRGRLRRSSYFWQILAIAFPVAFINVALGDSPESAGLGVLVGLGAGILASFPQVKRLHDLNMSGWFYWLSLIPLVNLIFGLYMLFARGTVGPNRYGPDPRDRPEE